MLRDLVKGFLSFVHRPSEEWDLGERRKLIRLRCHYKCQIDLAGKKLEAAILDMGVGGLRMRLCHNLKPGQKITVFSPFNEIGENSDPVQVQVCWVKQPERTFLSFAGTKYISEPKIMARSWVKGILKELGFRPEFLTSKRRWVRAEQILEGTLRRDDHSRQEIRIHNLGVGGALFEYRGILPLTEMTIRVGPFEKLPGLDVSGQLVKARPQGKHYLYGMEFGDLQPAQLRLLAVYLKHLLKESWEAS